MWICEGEGIVNRRGLLRSLLGLVVAPFVAKVVPRRPTLFGFPIVEATGDEFLPMAEPLVLGSFDCYGMHQASLTLAKGDDGGLVATAGEWEPILDPWTPDPIEGGYVWPLPLPDRVIRLGDGRAVAMWRDGRAAKRLPWEKT